MRRVELIPGHWSSVLGFGCAPILGSVDAKTARRAMECALDCGITHYDVARSYGYGEAERFVGKMLAARRDEVIIASKFGIRATRFAQWLGPIKPLVRRFRSSEKPAKPAAGPSAQSGSSKMSRFHQRVPLTPKAMTHSLEESLRNLGTDYLDLFFIHEPTAAIPRVEDLCARAEAFKASGKIRAWGLAISSEALDSHRASFEKFDIIQIDNSPGASRYAELVKERADRVNVFFSPLRNAHAETTPAETLCKLSADFPRSAILCSMFRPEHIRANAAALSD